MAVIKSSPPKSRAASYQPQVEWVSIGKLQKNARNARTHSGKQIRQIQASIKKFGFLNPILADDDNMILSGHGRSEAARLEGLAKVPVTDPPSSEDYE